MRLPTGSAAYDADILGDARHDYDLSLLVFLFDEYDLENFYEKFNNCKKSGDYLYLLKQYNPRSAKYLLNLREQQLTKTAMTVPILTEDSTLTFIYLKPLKESL